MTVEVKLAEFIRLDLFPAAIREIADEPTFSFEGDHRIIVTNNMIYIFADGGAEPKIVYAKYLEEFGGNNKDGYSMSSADGESLFVTRAQGCGCGSGLRAFFPFPGIPYITQLK